MKTTSPDSLLKAMQTAEGRWQDEEAKATGCALSYEQLTALRKGDSITVVAHYAVGGTKILRGRVTRVRQYGYTNLQGFWCATPDMPKSAQDAAQTLLGRTFCERLVPSYAVCFKTTDGYSERFQIGLERREVYSGWEVEP